MRLTEVLRENPKQLLLHVQQLLSEEHPNFETTLHVVKSDNGYWGGFRGELETSLYIKEDERAFVMTVKLLNLQPVLVYIGEKTGRPVAVGLSGQGRGNRSVLAMGQGSDPSPRWLADDVYDLMVEELIIQASIESHIPDNDIKAIFRNFVETKKVSSYHDIISVVLEKGDDEGLQSLEDRYNGTIYSTVNFTVAGETRTAVLLVKGV